MKLKLRNGAASIYWTNDSSHRLKTARPLFLIKILRPDDMEGDGNRS